MIDAARVVWDEDPEDCEYDDTLAPCARCGADTDRAGPLCEECADHVTVREE